MADDTANNLRTVFDGRSEQLLANQRTKRQPWPGANPCQVPSPIISKFVCPRSVFFFCKFQSQGFFSSHTSHSKPVTRWNNVEHSDGWTGSTLELDGQMGKAASLGRGKVKAKATSVSLGESRKDGERQTGTTSGHTGSRTRNQTDEQSQAPKHQGHRAHVSGSSGRRDPPQQHDRFRAETLFSRGSDGQTKMTCAEAQSSSGKARPNTTDNTFIRMRIRRAAAAKL